MRHRVIIRNFFCTVALVDLLSPKWNLTAAYLESCASQLVLSNSLTGIDHFCGYVFSLDRSSFKLDDHERNSDAGGSGRLADNGSPAEEERTALFETGNGNQESVASIGDFLVSLLEIGNMIENETKLRDERSSSKKRFKPDDRTSSDSGELYHSNSHLSSMMIKHEHLRGSVRGLLNRSGNDCFINATIQCLASTPLFRQWMLDEASTITVCTYTTFLEHDGDAERWITMIQLTQSRVVLSRPVLRSRETILTISLRFLTDNRGNQQSFEVCNRFENRKLNSGNLRGEQLSVRWFFYDGV